MNMHQSEFQTVRGSRGQALMVALLFFVIATVSIAVGIAQPVMTDVRLAKELEQSKQSYALAEAGAEDVAYRIIEGLAFSTTEVLSENGVYATTTVTDTVEGFSVSVVGDTATRIRKIGMELSESGGTSFNFGLQAGNGGIDLQNNSSVRGNIFANGPVTGENNNIVRGEVISAGPTGIVDGIHSTSSVYAHTISDSVIDGNAYYQAISGSTVSGTSYPGSTDQATTSLPISDAMIETWKAEAAAGGTSTTCTYSSGTHTLGPKKYNCTLLKIDSSAVINVAGAIWVEGNLEISGNADVRVASSVGNKSVVIVADKPSAPTTAGTVVLQNNSEYFGNGNKSFVMVISQNTSAENSGSTIAIDVKNNALGALLVYAGHGKIVIENNISLKEVTAYRIETKNNAEVVYESGLANLLFTSGPSSGFSIGGWGESD